MSTFSVPADRLKENDLIELDGVQALVVSTFVYRGEQRLKIVRDIVVGVESVELPEGKIVTVYTK